MSSLTNWLEDKALAQQKYHAALLGEQRFPGGRALLLKDSSRVSPSKSGSRRRLWFEFCDRNYRIDVAIPDHVVLAFNKEHSSTLNAATYPKQMFELSECTWIFDSPAPFVAPTPGQPVKRDPPRLCLEVNRIKLIKPKQEYKGNKGVKTFRQGAEPATRKWITEVEKVQAGHQEFATEDMKERQTVLRGQLAPFHQAQELLDDTPKAGPAPKDPTPEVVVPKVELSKGALWKAHDFITDRLDGNLEHSWTRCISDDGRRLRESHGKKMDRYYLEHPDRRPVPKSAGAPAFPQFAPAASTSRIFAPAPASAARPSTSVRAGSADTTRRISPPARSSAAPVSPARVIKEERDRSLPPSTTVRPSPPPSDDRDLEEGPVSAYTAAEKAKGRASSVASPAPSATSSSTRRIPRASARASSAAPAHSSSSPQGAHRPSPHPPSSSAPQRPQTRPSIQSHPSFAASDSNMTSAIASPAASSAMPQAGQLATGSFRASQWPQEPASVVEVSLEVTSQVAGQPMGGKQVPLAMDTSNEESGESGPMGRVAEEEEEREEGSDAEEREATHEAEDEEAQSLALSSPPRAPWEVEDDDDDEEEEAAKEEKEAPAPAETEAPVAVKMEVEESPKDVKPSLDQVDDSVELMSQADQQIHEDGYESEATTSSLVSSSSDDELPSAVQSQAPVGRSPTQALSQAQLQPSPLATAPSQTLTHISESQPSAPATQAPATSRKRSREPEQMDMDRPRKRSVSPQAAIPIEDEEVVPPTPVALPDLLFPLIRVYKLPPIRKGRRLSPFVAGKLKEWGAWSEKQRSWEMKRGLV